MNFQILVFVTLKLDNLCIWVELDNTLKCSRSMFYRYFAFHWNWIMRNATRTSFFHLLPKIDKTNISCRRWTRATLCVSSQLKSYQLLDCWWVLLTTGCDDRCAVAKLSKSGVGTKFQRGVPYFWDIFEFPRSSLEQAEENPCAKYQLGLFSRFDRTPTCDRYTQIHTLTDTGL